jgi:glycosyltransferase involved in cell wall biosynthesis
MKKVVWLCSWYPNRFQPFLGDFIERHAIAASQYADISALHVTRTYDTTIEESCHSEKKVYNDHLRAEIIYCNVRAKPGIYSRVQQHVQYFRQHIRWIEKYIAVHGKPDLIHVHVMLHDGMIALYIKWKFGIPYVITEHWTGYLPEARENFANLNPLVRSIFKRVAKNASGISAVSAYLGKSIKRIFGCDHILIPNVVNTEIFFPVETQSSKFRFIHVSGLDYQKNFEQIVDAVKILKANSTHAFELIVYGPDNNRFMELIRNYQLENIILFKGEVVQDVLAKDLQTSNALILYSRFETFGCVIIEAHACGLPVIVSDIPVMREIVSHKNGVFAKPNDPVHLAALMKRLIKNRNEFEKDQIAGEARERFAYPVVGEQIAKWYDEVPKS